MAGKKFFIATAAVFTSMCLFDACGSVGNETLLSIQENHGNDETQESENAVQISQEHRQEDEKVAVKTSDFGFDLLGFNIQDKNPVLSPVSAFFALSMAGCGADGTTRNEFNSVLGEDMMALSNDMMNIFSSKSDSLKLSIANSVWIDDEFTVNDVWMGTIQSQMEAEAYQSNLSTEETMNRINNWIDEKTNGLIDKMLMEPLNERTRLALFNTVYFKGEWKIPFEASNTYKEDFYLQRGQDDTEQVDMMNLYATDLDYISNDFVEGVILPYQNEGNQDMAFIALKPTRDIDIREAYGKLTSKDIQNIIVNKQTKSVNLKLPKFEITFDKNLNDSLKNMGLYECFDEKKANFDQMGKAKNGDNLYIGLVRQKAKIIVDEEGTEAAAVTEILMMCGAALEPDETKELYFNEPFIYMIMDLNNEMPLFIGILDNPVV
ncbi:MAG: serpin family protein [Lachnospiraceae bacterium]|nr:serpin family protein [Lachnospiraceae bacterium]